MTNCDFIDVENYNLNQTRLIHDTIETGSKKGLSPFTSFSMIKFLKHKPSLQKLWDPKLI